MAKDKSENIKTDQAGQITRPKVVTTCTIDKYAVTKKGLIPHLKDCRFSGSAAAIFDRWLEGEKLRITIEQVQQDMFGG